ncbi:MAG: lytic transglycosylase domain-containing protein [Candidatus Binatia bacterium]
MEKRLKKTLARTLNCGADCTKLVLVVALFIPAFWSFDQISAPIEEPPHSGDGDASATAERPRPKQLVKAYSIVKSRRPEIADTEAWRISEVILEESSKRQLDPLLIMAIIQIESDFQHAAVSPVGARGLMQIMPDTGRYLADALHRERGLRPAVFRPESLDDPLHNIRLGAYYLHGLRKQFKDINLALIAYNLGPGEVQNRIENDLEFSDQFADVVLDTYQNYKKSPTRF